jgi:spore coat polysaccharide biosynthesis protein SpsF
MDARAATGGRVVAVLQARTGSTRLPGKILAPLDDQPALHHVVDRCRHAALIDEVVVATTVEPGDGAIAQLCAERGWACFRGSEADVLDRHYQAALAHEAAHVVRVTSDCPLVDVDQLERMVAHHLASGADFTHSLGVWGAGSAHGAAGEVFSMATLEASWREARDPYHREHVDEYVHDQRGRFAIERVDALPELWRPEVRVTLDTAADLELLREIYRRVGARPVPLVDAIALIDEDPVVADLHARALAAAAAAAQS